VTGAGHPRGEARDIADIGGTTVLTFDSQDPEHARSGVPFGVLQEIRSHQGVYRSPSGQWYLARQDDIYAALRDVATFRTDLAPNSGLAGIEEVPDDELFLSEIPEPRHGQVRRLYNKYFGPHRVGRVEPFVRELCGELVDRMLTKAEVDLHVDYAMAIPAGVMSRIMGLPDDAADKFMEWSFDGTLMLRPSSPGVGDDGPPICRYFLDQLEQRRAQPDPPDDVFATMVAASIDGEPLSDREIVTQLQFMIQAGVHTTRGLLVHAMHRLLISPALFEELKRDRRLVERFIEESLRHDSPVLATTRRCMQDARLDDVPMRRGDWVQVGIASGNRDEKYYDDAEAFRLDRPEPRNHLAFGAGPHVCPGATLARLEAVTAVDVLLSRVDAMTPVPGADYPPLPGGLHHRGVPARLVAAGAEAGPRPDARRRADATQVR
jgi:cytochrome P450